MDNQSLWSIVKNHYREDVTLIPITLLVLVLLAIVVMVTIPLVISAFRCR